MFVSCYKYISEGNRLQYSETRTSEVHNKYIYNELNNLHCSQILLPLITGESDVGDDNKPCDVPKF